MTSPRPPKLEERMTSARYVVSGRGRLRLLPPGEVNLAHAQKVEDWVAHRLTDAGKVVVRGELEPFGNMLGGLMHPVLPLTGVVYVGHDEPWPRREVWKRHIADLPHNRRALATYFRDHLAATRPARARLIGEVSAVNDAVTELLVLALASAHVKACLEYLVEDYWDRRAGWPDLVALDFAASTNEPHVEFIEVKSRRDRVGRDQRAWFTANSERLSLDAHVLRVNADEVIEAPGHTWSYEPPTRVWAPANFAAVPLVSEALARDRASRERVRAEVAARRAALERDPLRKPDVRLPPV